MDGGVDDAGAFDAPAPVLLNKWQLAEALGVSANTVDRWRMEGMPVVSAGSNGRAYQFDPAACIAWREARERRREEEAQKAEDLVRQLRLQLDPVAETRREHLSPAQQREQYEAAARYMAVARQRRELVEADPMVEALEAAFAAIRDALDALPDQLGRELGLTGDQVERLVTYCDRAMDRARRNCIDLVEGGDDATGA